MEEYSSTGNSWTVHGLGIDDVNRITKNGVNLYPLTNDQGSVYAVTDASGNVLQRYDYSPYGKVTVQDANGVILSDSEESIPLVNRLYQGRELDQESGLYFYRARYYSPELGRFISHDPLGFVDGCNLYEFVRGNPGSYTDPMGLNTAGAAGPLPIDILPPNLTGPMQEDAGIKEAAENASQEAASGEQGKTNEEATESSDQTSDSREIVEQEETTIKEPIPEQNPDGNKETHPITDDAEKYKTPPTPAKQEEIPTVITEPVPEQEAPQINTHPPVVLIEIQTVEKKDGGNNTTEESSSNTHGHHSDPKYLGGNPEQKLTDIEKQDHVNIHKEIDSKYPRFKGKSYYDKLRKSNSNFDSEVQKDLTDIYNKYSEKYPELSKNYENNFNNRGN